MKEFTVTATLKTPAYGDKPYTNCFYANNANEAIKKARIWMADTVGHTRQDGKISYKAKIA